MKIIVFMMSLLFVTPLFGVQKPTQPLVRSLIILINLNSSIKDAVFVEFVIAMCQKAAPILVHKNTLITYIKMLDGLTRKSGEEPKKLSSVLALSQFDVYERKKGEFLLIVPHIYKEKLTKQFPGLSLADLLGFDVENSDLFFHVEADDVQKYMAQADKRKFVSADEILALFQRKNAESSNGLWNIYLVGHGDMPRRLKENVPLFEHKKLKEMINLENSPYTAGLRVDEFRKLITYFQEFNTNFLFYKSCYAGGYNVLMPFVTNLFVGELMSTEKAQALWPTVAQENRATKIPQIKSGVLVKGELKEEGAQVVHFNPRFTIAVGSAFDTPVTTEQDMMIKCGLKGAASEGPINFNAFFDLLTEYTQQELKIKNAGLKPIRFSDNELRNILSTVTENVEQKKDPLGLRSMPQVRFPKIGQFVPFPLDPQKVFVLSNVLIKGAQLEKKSVLIPDSPAPEAVIMPVSEIPVTIKISTQKMPALIAMLTGISVNIINEINAEKVLFADFVRAFGLLDVEFVKYFFIKKVVVSKDKNGPLLKKELLVLTDVLIAVINGNIRMFYTTADNSVYFTAVYVSGDKKEKINIQSFMLQDSALTNFLPIVPGSDAHMPDYLSLYRQQEVAVDKAFYDWNKHASPGTLAMALILPHENDRSNFWEFLEQMSTEQRIKSQTIERKAEQRRAELTTKK